MRISDWSSDVCSSELHLGDRLPAFLSGIPGFQYRVCLPSVLTQRHRRAALEDDYHRLAGGFERVQQITLRFGQGDAGTVATIEPWHLERHLLALEPGVEPDERNDRVGLGSHRNQTGRASWRERGGQQG